MNYIPNIRVHYFRGHSYLKRLLEGKMMIYRIGGYYEKKKMGDLRRPQMFSQRNHPYCD